KYVQYGLMVEEQARSESGKQVICRALETVDSLKMHSAIVWRLRSFSTNHSSS
uniref:PID domain-containing protein n=1 Tax=Bursaphelenchus xylophilus TaxID=6326 RepID=A0A1I7SKN0_BURXY